MRYKRLTLLSSVLIACVTLIMVACPEQKPESSSINASTWRMVAGKVNHTVGIKENRTLWAWGSNEYGQLGDGTKTDRSSPVQVIER